MQLKDRLDSHPVSNLRKEVSKKAKEVNLRGYSKMKKADLINFMLKHSDKFNYIKEHVKGTKGEPKKVKVVRKTKGGKVTGGSVDGKPIKEDKFDKIIKQLKEVKGKDNIETLMERYAQQNDEELIFALENTPFITKSRTGGFKLKNVFLNNPKRFIELLKYLEANQNKGIQSINEAYNAVRNSYDKNILN